MGAFIIFTIIILKLEATERAKRQLTFQEIVKAQNTIMVDLLDREREYRREIRTGVMEAMNSLTESIKKMDERSSKEHQQILVALVKHNGH